MLASLLLAVALTAAPARPPVKGKVEPASAEKDPAAQAKELFGYAMKLYGQARYVEAIAKFEEAYALKPHAVIFFNIGKCYEQLGETAKALRAYRDYLRLSPDAADKETVNDAITNLERRLKEKGVQQLMVYADPATSHIEVDGKPLGTSPASVELTAGNHVLVVKNDGYETVERSFVMSVQRSTEITINLRQKAADAPVRETPVALTPASPAPELSATAPAPRKGRVGTWVAGGVAVAGLGAGIALGVMSSSANGQLHTLTPDRTTAQADGLKSQSQGLATGANIAYGVAGAAAITAVILFFVEGRN